MESVHTEIQKKQREDTEIFYRLDSKTTWLHEVTLLKQCSTMVESFASFNVLKQFMVSVEPLNPYHKSDLMRECSNGNVLTLIIVKNEDCSEDVFTVVNAIKCEPSNRCDATNKELIISPHNDVNVKYVMQERAETFCNVVSTLLNNETKVHTTIIIASNVMKVLHNEDI